MAGDSKPQLSHRNTIEFLPQGDSNDDLRQLGQLDDFAEDTPQHRTDMKLFIAKRGTDHG